MLRIQAFTFLFKKDDEGKLTAYIMSKTKTTTDTIR